MQDLEYTKSPRDNLDTWTGLKSVAIKSMVAIIIVLALMAAFLT